MIGIYGQHYDLGWLVTGLSLAAGGLVAWGIYEQSRISQWAQSRDRFLYILVAIFVIAAIAMKPPAITNVNLLTFAPNIEAPSKELTDLMIKTLTSYRLYGAALYRCVNIREGKNLSSPSKMIDNYEDNLLTVAEKTIGASLWTELIIAMGRQASGPIRGGTPFETDRYRLAAVDKILQNWIELIVGRSFRVPEIKIPPEVRKLLNPGTPNCPTEGA